MASLRLYVQAPFAVFRRFAAGSFRPTAAFITPTAAYGLALNLAGIESRHDDGKSPMTLTNTDLPSMRIALGLPESDGASPSFPASASVFQQLHNYPVGNSGKEHAPNTKGTKYNVTPVRREFLLDLTAIIVIDASDKLTSEVKNAVNGVSRTPRYGVPFLGDNAFSIDVLSTGELANQSAWWITPLTQAAQSDVTHELATRLTTFIDRSDSSNSRSSLCAPCRSASFEPPSDAWFDFGFEHPE